MRPALSLLVIAALLFPVSGASADERFARLAEPGVVAVMRHADAPGTGDAASFRLDDCATQRNLGPRGRTQAREIGAAIRTAGVEVDRVLTSQWCRCRDTARLLEIGPVEDLPALNSFFREPSRADAQTVALRSFLQSVPPEETLVLVTHFVNIRALTGRGVASGEVVFIELHEDGIVTVVDTVLIGP